MVLLDNILWKKQTTLNQPNQSTQSTISVDEDTKIKNWINQKYQWQSEAIKTAAYKDAYNAVAKRKAENVEKANNEIKRQLNAQTASYVGNDKVKQEQAKLAKAEMAVSDAAEIIRQWQIANGQKVNSKLTDKQLVDSFLLANNWKPFAEYVSKYLNWNISWNSDYNNLWLASKLWLDTWSTLWVDNRTIINAKDKLSAWIRWVGQWLVNLTQNTIWAWMNFLWSNLWAWLGELWYSVANIMWADTSEGSVWDKLKKAEWYSWSEAKDKANSHLWKWVLSEDKGAYDIWEWLWETAAEIALTAPAEFAVWWAITASKAPKIAKFWMQALNAAWAWAAFQWAEDLTNWELSSTDDYLNSAALWAWTAWVGNVLGKVVKSTSNAAKKLPRIVLWAWDRTENAIIKKSVQEWDDMSNISKWFASDANAAKTPYTELAKPLKQAKETLNTDRINKGRKLEEIRNNLQYVWKSTKDWSMYTTKEVVNDLNNALKTLSDPKKYWKKVKDVNKIPQFELKDGKLALSEESLEQLNAFNWVNAKWKDVNLWDEIIKLYNRVYWWGEKINAATTESFIRELKSLYKQWWSGWDNNLLSVTLNSLDEIENKFNNSLTSKSLSNLQKYSKLDEEAIKLDKNFDKLIWVMDKWSVEDVKAAVKALKWNQTTEQYFKALKDATWVDMNNEVLARAYNLSLYDVSKAKDLLSTFYPSKAWVIETLLQQISKPLREKVARSQVKSWIRTKDLWQSTDTDRLNTVFVQISNAINANDNNK